MWFASNHYTLVLSSWLHFLLSINMVLFLTIPYPLSLLIPFPFPPASTFLHLTQYYSFHQHLLPGLMLQIMSERNPVARMVVLITTAFSPLPETPSPLVWPLSLTLRLSTSSLCARCCWFNKKNQLNIFISPQLSFYPPMSPDQNFFIFTRADLASSIGQ